MNNFEKNMKKYGIAVIGGGAAGLAAACQAGESEFSTILLEQNDSLGKKLLITGGGHCNFSHEGSVADLVSCFHGQGKFLYSAFSKFGRERYLEFLQDAGLATTVDDRGRYLPKNGKADSVLAAFTHKLAQNRTDIVLSTKVIKLEQLDTGWLITAERNDNKNAEATTPFFAQTVILTSGTAAYPSTGANTSGLQLADSCGHQIIPLSSALAPIMLRETWVADLAGVTLADCGLSIRAKGGKVLESARGELLFTHKGVTGPLPLSLSRWIHQEGEWEVILDFVPDENAERIFELLKEAAENHPTGLPRRTLRQLIPESVAAALMQAVDIDPKAQANRITYKAYRRLAGQIKRCILTSSGPLPPTAGMTCRGGVNLSEVSSQTMMSKLCAGLFFAGDMLDLDGFSGGYNLQAAFSTGMLAGASAVACLRGELQG